MSVPLSAIFTIIECDAHSMSGTDWTTNKKDAPVQTELLMRSFNYLKGIARRVDPFPNRSTPLGRRGENLPKSYLRRTFIRIILNCIS